MASYSDDLPSSTDATSGKLTDDKAYQALDRRLSILEERTAPKLYDAVLKKAQSQKNTFIEADTYIRSPRRRGPTISAGFRGQAPSPP